ncbi:type II secretion system F family protein [Candidatus Wolfebacteria bacterium]|nr:type II secretion system F family protein [Candidatus Wolfebacteria bacterium]
MNNNHKVSLLQSVARKFVIFFTRVPLSEKILFAKHLSMMVNAGMTEVESIRLIRKQIKSRGFGKILDKIIADLESGLFLSVSLKQFPRAFGEIFINLIEIGEITGTLSQNLNFLSVELKKSQQLRSKVRSALIYPIVILAATLGVGGMLIFFVLPKILPVFYSLRIELPVETKILVAASNFLLHYYLWVILGFFVFFILMAGLLKIPFIRFYYHRLILALPIIGKIAIAYNMANTTRTLGILLKSGIKIVEAILINANITSNDVYKKSFYLVAEEIKKGESFYKYFENNSKIFPPTITRMIEVGENTGKLEENLFYLADFYENEVDEITKDLSSILEPVLLVVMGSLVGFVVVSIIKPIYEVSRSITR